MDLRQQLLEKSNKEMYGIFKPPDNYYIVNDYPLEGTPGFFPCINHSPKWLAIDIDTDISKTLIKSYKDNEIENRILNIINRFEDNKGDYLLGDDLPDDYQNKKYWGVFTKTNNEILLDIHEKPEFSNDLLEYLYLEMPFLKNRLWIEESRHGYHLFIFINHFMKSSANSLANLIGNHICNYDDRFVNDIVYPSGDDGNSYFIKNTNIIILEGKELLDFSDIRFYQPQLNKITNKVDKEDYTNKKNYYYDPPFCFMNISLFYKAHPEIYHHANGHVIRIMYANHLRMLGLNVEDQINSFKIFDDFNYRKTSNYINHLRRKNYRPPTCKGLSNYMGPICNYCKNIQFKNRYQKYDELFKPGRLYLNKFTRAGFTTYIILKCLKMNLKLLIVEPTHKISDVMENVNKIYQDKFKLIHLKANIDVCEKARLRHISTGLYNIPRGNCARCELKSGCTYSDIQNDLQQGNYDIVYCTYHKFVLTDMDDYDFDVVFFDEFTTSKNLISNLTEREYMDLPVLTNNNKYKVISDNITQRINNLFKMRHKRFIEQPIISDKESMMIVDYLLYLKRISRNYFKTILKYLNFINGSVLRLGNRFYSFNLFSILLGKIRSMNNTYIFATDTNIPEFINEIDFKVDTLPDIYRTDSKFIIVDKEIKKESCYIISKNKNSNNDYYRSTTSRGIGMEYEKPIYLEDVSYSPIEGIRAYLYFLKRYGYLTGKLTFDRVLDSLEQEALNQAYQSISRFKTSFYNDQKIFVYYNAECRGMNKLIKNLRRFIKRKY